MKFSLKSLFQKKTHTVYAALLVSESSGRVLYIVPDGELGMKVLGSQKLRLHAGWDGLIDDLDDALYNLDTTHKVRVNELILFVSDFHVEVQTRVLHKPFLKTIKDIAKHLDLQPIGFIECYEAVLRSYRAHNPHDAHHAIMLEFEQEHVSIMVVIGDSVVHHDKIVRLDDWLGAVNTSLSTLKHKHVLPQTMLVYSPDATAIDVGAIEQYDWTEGLFATGKPSVVPHEYEAVQTALLQAFANQLFPQQANSISQSAAVGAVGLPQAHTPVADAAADVLDEAHSEKPLDAPEAELVESLGFHVGAHAPEDVDLPADVPARPMPPPSVADFGQAQASHLPNEVLAGVPAKKASPVAAAQLLISEKGVKAHTAILSLFTKMKSSMTGMGGGRSAMILLPLAALIFLAVVFEVTVHKASVTITLPSEQLSQTVRLPQTFEYKQASISSSFTASTKATGTTFIGERAKGVVTLYNSDTSGSVSFQKGQAISTSDGLTFTLDDAVKVASASGDASSITSSTAKAAVTASKIGTEFNIKQGAKFTVDGVSSSDVVGKNESEITGGTKEEVTIVSEEDYGMLEEQIEKQAADFAAKQLKETGSSDLVVIPDMTKTILSKKVYTADIGDEVSEVSLSAQSQISYTAISRQTALSYFEKLFAEDVGSSKKLIPETFEFAIQKAATTSAAGRVSVEGKIKAVARHDQSEVKAGIAHKFPQEAESYLINSFQAQDVKISQFPPLPLWLPAATRIELTIEY